MEKCLYTYVQRATLLHYHPGIQKFCISKFSHFTWLIYFIFSSQIGFIVSFNAFTQVSTGVAMKFIVKVVPKNYHQLSLSCLLYATAVCLLTSISSSTYIYIPVILMSIGTTVSKVSAISFTHDIVGKDHTSVLVGMNSSLTSIARLASPVIVGYLMDWYTIYAPIYVVIFVQLFSFSLCILLNRNNKGKQD